MSENWDDRKYMTVELSSFTLPVLRDFGVYFIAMIEFDIFLGPVVTLTEIMQGSTFISQLKNSRQLSEVYAGVARTNLNEITVDDKTKTEKIAVSRITPDSEEDLVTVLLISVNDDRYLDEVKKLGEIIIQKSGGSSEDLANVIQTSIRNHIEAAKTTFEKKDESLKLTFDNENRPLKSLGLSNINGFFLVDLKSKYCEFNNLPLWIDEVKFNAKDVLSSIEGQLKDIKNEITTIFINGIPFMAVKGRNDTFGFICLKSTSIGHVSIISKWFSILVEALSDEWKSADRREILAVLTLIDEAGIRGTTPERIRSLGNLLIRSMRIKPIVNYNLPELNDPPPYFLSKSRWDDIISFNGMMTIDETALSWMESVLATVLLLDWARSRRLIFLLDKD